ncbi:MAG TPA: transposase [Azospirillum sp.]|nr:transposase [Azospirillum sp.]
MAWKEVSDEFWARVEPLLPAPKKHRIGGGRPRISDRVVLNAILVKNQRCSIFVLRQTKIPRDGMPHFLEEDRGRVLALRRCQRRTWNQSPGGIRHERCLFPPASDDGGQLACAAQMVAKFA